MSVLLDIVIGVVALVLAFVGWAFVKFWQTAREYKPKGYTTFQMMRGMAQENRRQRRGGNG